MTQSAADVLKTASIDRWGDESDAAHITKATRPINKLAWSDYGGIVRPAGEVKEALNPGQYEVGADQSGLYFQSLAVETDELILLQDSVTEEVINEIDRFWLMEKAFQNFGFVWKRGVLLYGPPGSGKTATVQLIAQAVIQSGGIALFCSNPALTARGLKVIRGIEPTRPIVVMFEDVDSIIEKHGDSEMLAMLDGELQVDRVVFVATTNYIDQLADRFTKRPSRFDLVREVGMPGADVRRAFLSNKLHAVNAAEIEKWVEITEGFGIAHIKELIIANKIFGYDLEKSAEKLRSSLPKTDEDNDDDSGDSESKDTDGDEESDKEAVVASSRPRRTGRVRTRKWRSLRKTKA